MDQRPSGLSFVFFALVVLALWSALPACSGGGGGSSGSSGSTGSTGTTGSTGSTGTSGANCDGGIGSAQVQNWPSMTYARATQFFTYAFNDGGADASKLTVTMDREYIVPGCGTAVGTGYERFRVVLDSTTGGVGPGTYGIGPDAGYAATVRWEFSSDTSGGAQDANAGSVAVTSVTQSEAQGTFAADVNDPYTTFDDGGRPLYHVTATFDAVYGGQITEP